MDADAFQDYLLDALKCLALHKDAQLGLWNFLYDRSNDLASCVGAIKLVLIDPDLSPESRELLHRAETKVEALFKEMRGAILKCADSGSAHALDNVT